MGRFVSADTVVPGNAAGGMDGIAVKPLTVDFHEGGFLSKLNQENSLGFWFTLSGEQRRQAGSPWGPANAQALNRYSYVQNNPLRWTDPTGHWTFSVNFGFILGGGGALRGTVSVAIDGNLNVGVFVGGGGGSMVGGAVGTGPSVTFTGAPSLENLKGVAIQIGGQIGEGGGLTGEAVIIPNKGEKPYTGISIGGKATVSAPFPAEGHTTVEYSYGRTLRDSFNDFQYVYNGMRGIVEEGFGRLHQYTYPTLP